MTHTPGPWVIDWYKCRANDDDVEYAKKAGRKIKAGDLLWRVPRSIGPVHPDHSHWIGWHLPMEEGDALAVSRVPEMLAILRELDNSRQLTPSMSARVRALLAYVDGVS